MLGATIAHSLVAAHDDRVQDFARLYGALARIAAAHGAESAQVNAAHRDVGDQIVAWERADHAAELRDVVTLSADERTALIADTARAMKHAERNAQGLPPGSREDGVARALKRLHADFPTTLTRAALVRTKRSAARLARFEALNGPAFLLGGEAEVFVDAIESATTPFAPIVHEPDPHDGFRSTLAWGLRACLVLSPGAAGAADLGLGVSPAVATALGVSGQDLETLYERWVRSPADESHPFARYPYAPPRRFGDPRGARSDLESTGPVGWAAAADTAGVARDLRAAAGEHRPFATELSAAGDRVDAAAAQGHAVVGWIEYLSAEDEGQRKWLVDPEADGG